MQQISPQHIQNVLSEKCAVLQTDKLILAISGGADSMALLHILYSLGYDVVAAHCNFNLRGEASDADEQVVRAYCKALSVPLHVQSFETTDYANKNAVSIEMAARELRYAWFDELKEEIGFQAIVTGHHGNDSIETFFLNLARGTGVKGLSGIQFRNGHVIRPLLDYPRSAVEAYCANQGIEFVHDQSNDDTRFIRNKIRHEILPVFESINPSFFDTMKANMAHIQEAEYMLEQEVEHFRQTVLVDEHDRVIIPISKLTGFKYYQTILFEVLRPYGFNSTIVNNIVLQLHGTPGKQFFSSTHRLIKDRHNLLIMPVQQIDVQHFWLSEAGADKERKIQVKLYPKPADFKFSRNPKCIHLDADQVDLPILVRKWQNGDSFMPLGMTGFKKVSDFFIDEKYSLAEKEDAWLMVSGDNIVGILGKRIDDRYKVIKRTRNILEIKLED